MPLTIALAARSETELKKAHFGDADFYRIYRLDSGSMELIDTLPNPFSVEEEEGHHSNPGKGRAVVKLLKERGVQVLVSPQFGKNINIVKKSFAIVLSKELQIEAVLLTLGGLKIPLRWRAAQGKRRKSSESEILEEEARCLSCSVVVGHCAKVVLGL